MHALWGMAVGTGGYDKEDWTKMDRLIEKLISASTPSDLQAKAIAVLQLLDDEGDSHGRCVSCRGSPCYPSCLILEVLRKAGVKAG